MNISRRQLLRGRVSLDDLSHRQPMAESSELPKVKQLDISSDCLAFNQVSCRSCQDTCETQAIRFQLQIGKPAYPTLDNEQCNQCGACFGVCPSRAISFVEKTIGDEQNSKEIGDMKGAQL